MKDNEITKFREVLGIEEEIKVPEPDLQDIVSVKTTAFYKVEKVKTNTTPKSQVKISRKNIAIENHFDIDDISQISPSSPQRYK